MGLLDLDRQRWFQESRRWVVPMFFLAAVLCAIATGFEITFDEFSLFKLAIGTMAVVVFAGFGALLHNVGDQRSIEAQVFSVHN